MIQVKKTRKAKNRLAIIITSAVLASLIVGLSVTWYFLNKEPESEESNASKGTDFFPDVDSEDITGFEVLFPKSETDDEKNPKQSFGAVLEDGTYYFFYYNDDKRELYKPQILSEEKGFDYTSLYAVSDDGMNVPKISYVLYALANTSYNSSIEIPDLSEEEREKQLSVYGLDKEHRKALSFTYAKTVKNEDGTEEEKTFGATVYVGNKLITKVGYYLMIDYPNIDEYKDQRETARKYIYVSQGAENFSHALDGFSSFVSPRLVMAGNLANNDKAVYSQLTPSYRQWKSVVHKSGKVTSKAEVVFTANVRTAAYAALSDIKNQSMKVGADGYATVSDEMTTMDLEYTSSKDIYKNFVNLLVGKEVGDYSDNKITPLVVIDQNEATLGKNYKYKIYEIESVADADGIERAYGSVDGSVRYVKVRYSCTIDGEDVVYSGADADKLHAVIDLSDEKLSSEFRNKIRGLSVGVLGSPLEYETVYTKDNTTSSTFELRISRINNVVNANTGATVDKITDKTAVNFVYQLVYNNVVAGEDNMVFDLSASTEGMAELDLAIRSALLGAKLEETGAYEKDITAYSTTVYYQAFKNFVSYEISKINYFVEREEVVSFRFVNNSERDPFYGEAIHINTLQNHKYSSYALDTTACDRVIKVLSGTLLGASSTVFEGMTGDKVVAVGLTPEIMDKYGLYAYTVYYELPRYVVDVAPEGEDAEYTWWDTVGFTLYISEKDIDGKRCVASDMFDLVVELEGDILDFVEESFVDFWARRDIFMVDNLKVNNLTAEFNLEGFKGKYSFTVEHPTMWIVNYMDGTTKLEAEEPADDAEGVKEKAPHEATYVYVNAEDFEGATQTLLLERLKAQGAFPGKDGIHIHAIYDYLYTNGLSSDKQTVGYDYLGDSCFKDVLYILYGTGYLGKVSEEDYLDAKSRGAVMSLKMNVEGSKVDNTYNFYYTADGRVAVEIVNGAGATCYFYVTNHAFKMVVGAFINLLNGRQMDFSGAYGKY